MKWLHGCVLCCFFMLCISPQLVIFKSVASVNAIHFNLELLSRSSNPLCVSSRFLFNLMLCCITLSSICLYFSSLAFLFTFAPGGAWRWVAFTQMNLQESRSAFIEKANTIIQNRSGKTWIEPGRFWCLPKVITPPSGMQSKRTGSMSRIGDGCQLPWVPRLELAKVNEWGWIIKHCKRPSLGEEEAGRSRLLTQRLNRSPVKHLNKN